MCGDGLRVGAGLCGDGRLRPSRPGRSPAAGSAPYLDSGWRSASSLRFEMALMWASAPEVCISRQSSELTPLVVQLATPSLPWLSLATRYSVLSLPILPHFAIHGHGHILMHLHIPKLHHLMFLPRQFPPPARFLRILLNRLQHPPVQPKLNHPQPPTPHALNRNPLTLHQNNLAIHQLPRHRPQSFLHLSQRYRPLSARFSSQRPTLSS
jgi:hypothetical protein